MEKLNTGNNPLSSSIIFMLFKSIATLLAKEYLNEKLRKITLEWHNK